MKEVRFKFTHNGKKYSGYYLTEERPSNPVSVIERLVGAHLKDCKTFVIDKKIKMIKTTENNQEGQE